MRNARRYSAPDPDFPRTPEENRSQRGHTSDRRRSSLSPTGAHKATTRLTHETGLGRVAVAAGMLVLAMSSGSGSRARAGQETRRTEPQAAGKRSDVAPEVPEEKTAAKTGPARDAWPRGSTS